MEEKPSHSPWIIAALLLAIPCLYIAGYFTLSEARRLPAPGGNRILIRVYPADRVARLFWPMTKVESWATGEKVLAGARGQ